MVRKSQLNPSPPRVLIAGNYCHDVLIQHDAVKAESLGGAASFISNVLDRMSVPCTLVAKVGNDFKYPVHNHTPISIPTCKTTVFYAFFDTGFPRNGHQDRVLKRVCACDPIQSSDLPESRFDFGMAVGVGGEISPETLEGMFRVCDVVFVDIQSLIREFDCVDGTVKLVKLESTKFYELLPRVGVLKASSEEAMYMDVEEVRKWCCVVVTNGKDGCKLYWKDGEMGISPFVAHQEDPTGAGDSFLGGFVAGLVHGLSVPDAALLGNFFGSLTVEQIGLPKFDLRLLQRVKNEVQRRKMQCLRSERGGDELKFSKQAGHEQFHALLAELKLLPPCSSEEYLSPCSTEENHWDEPSSPVAMQVPQSLLHCRTGQPNY